MPTSKVPSRNDSMPLSITHAVVPMANRCNNFLPVKYGNKFLRMANSMSSVTTKIAAPAEEKRRIEDMLRNIA